VPSAARRFVGGFGHCSAPHSEAAHLRRWVPSLLVRVMADRLWAAARAWLHQQIQDASPKKKESKKVWRVLARNFAQ